jgi:hypothetical protein
MIITREERRPSGEYSEVRVIALGRAPPSPRPVTNRSRVSIPIEGAKAEARLATPNKRTVRARIARRPSRSASGPKAKAPIMSPKSPAPNSGASCAGVAPHSARMAGAMNPTAMVSKPSKATTRKHRTRSRTWTWDSPRASMNRWTSIGSELLTCGILIWCRIRFFGEARDRVEQFQTGSGIGELGCVEMFQQILDRSVGTRVRHRMNLDA